LSCDGIVTLSGTGLKGLRRETVRPHELLGRTLAEEKKTDDSLTKSGETAVNDEAAAWHPASAQSR
jgi:hypothetical protein